MRKDIDGTISVVDAWIKDIKSLQNEIAEINSAWITELGSLETDKLKEVGRLSQWLKDNIQTLPFSSKTGVEKFWDKEKKLLKAETQKLEKSIKKNMSESFELEIEINKHRKKVEEDNPEFDEQEEALKSKIEEVLADVKDVDKELAKYDSFRGWFNGKRVKKLKTEFDKKMRKLNRLTGRLEELRGTWHKTLSDKDNSENEKQDFWAKLQNFITEDKFELGHIEEQFDDITLSNVVLEMLDIDTPSGFPKEQNESFSKAKKLKSRVESINKGIKRLASLIGAINGVGKGLSEMNKSFHSLRKTQRAHTQLPKLSIEIPDSVVKYNSIWQTLVPKVKNEKKFVDDPTHLADEFDKIGSKYLSMENIKTMFDLFGGALKESTAGWSA
jgi:chromosome segregation ATPase